MAYTKKNMDVRVVYTTPAGERKELVVVTPAKPPAPAPGAPPAPLAVNVRGLKAEMAVEPYGGDGGAVNAIIKKQLGAGVAAQLKEVRQISSVTDERDPTAPKTTAIYMANLGTLTPDQEAALLASVGNELSDAMIYTQDIDAPPGPAAAPNWIGPDLKAKFEPTAPKPIDRAEFQRLRHEEVHNRVDIDQVLRENLPPGSPLRFQQFKRDAAGHYAAVGPRLAGAVHQPDITQQFIALQGTLTEADAILQRAGIVSHENSARANLDVNAFLTLGARGVLAGQPIGAYRAAIEKKIAAYDARTAQADPAQIAAARRNLVAQYAIRPAVGGPTPEEAFKQRQARNYLLGAFGYDLEAKTEEAAKARYLASQKAADVKRWLASGQPFTFKGDDFALTGTLDLTGIDPTKLLSKADLENLWDAQVARDAEARFDKLNDLYSGTTSTDDFITGLPPASYDLRRMRNEMNGRADREFGEQLDKEARQAARVQAQLDQYEAKRGEYIANARRRVPPPLDAEAEFNQQKARLAQLLQEAERDKERLLQAQKDMLPKAPTDDMTKAEREENKKKADDFEEFMKAAQLRDLEEIYKKGLKKDSRGQIYDAQGNNIFEAAMKDTGHLRQGKTLDGFLKSMREIASSGNPPGLSIAAGIIIDLVMLCITRYNWSSVKGFFNTHMLDENSTEADYALNSLMHDPTGFGTSAVKLMGQCITVDADGKAEVDFSKAIIDKDAPRAADRFILAAALAVTEYGVDLKKISLPEGVNESEVKKLIGMIEKSKLELMKERGIKPELYDIDTLSPVAGTKKKGARLDDDDPAARLVI